MFQKTNQVKKLLANADAFSFMTRTQRHTAAHSSAKYSFLALIITFLFICIYGYRLTLPVSKKSDPQEFKIEKGESVTLIANHLKSAKLIRSPLYFRYIVRQQNLTLQAGVYQISPSLLPKTIATTLTKGLAVDHKLIIPEGFRAEQIAETAGLSIKEFLTAVKNLEGQLFPDTYFIRDGITSAELVTILHDNFVKKSGTVDKQTLILASLVERETRGNEEKPVVAGILKKRLDAGWPLELDATIQYVLGKPGNWWPNTTLLDRKFSSPYNTYLHTGLPPGPIGNPGLTSIRAVQNSVESPYWFYLHDKSGGIHYGATLEEHNQNISKYIN